MQIAGTGYVRPTSIFLEPAFLGGYLSFVVALVLAYALSRRSPLSLPAALGGFAAGATILVALLATVSWGAYLDFAAVLLALLPAIGRKVFRHPRLAFAFAAALALAAAAGAFSEPGRAAVRAAGERWRMLRETPVESDRMSPDVQDSSWARARNARHTQDLIQRYPVRGVGLGHFEKHAAPGDSYMAVVSTRDPWCGWLAIGAETGVAGPLVLAGIVVLVMVRFVRNRPSGFAAVAVPALVALAAIEQVHTGSYIDLWWWYPLSAAAVLAAPSIGPAPADGEV
jgi:O-antigen ligase